MPGARPAGELGLAEKLEHELERQPRASPATPCRCAGGRRAHRLAQQRAQPRRGVALAALGRLGAQQRGERGDLHRQVRPRDGAGGVGLEQGLCVEALVDGGERRQRVGAARRVAVGLGGGDRRLAEQVDRRADPVAPQLAQRRQGGLRVLADDEAMRHVAHAGGAGGAERGAAGLRIAHLHRRAQRRRAVVDLLEKAGQVGGEIVERAAGRHDVDEAKQRGAQLVVLRGEVHGTIVERLQRLATVARERLVQRAADALDLRFERRGRGGL